MPRDRAGVASYGRALAALERALVFGIHPSLDGIRALTDVLGRPQDAFRSVQVAGTNGKTSTARFAAALLEAEGVATGLYTSPHLERYPERIEVSGAVVSDAEFGEAVGMALDAAEALRPSAQGTSEGFTEFELLTAAALWLFRERGVEVAVLEVGLGGRWDATSVVDAAVAVVTGVALDHTAILGDTREQIAAEKAGIVKPGSIAVLGPGTVGVEDVILQRASEVAAAVWAARLAAESSPVSEDRTVRYELTERSQAPGGLTVVDVRGVFGSYPRLAVCGPSVQAANVATGAAAVEAVLGRALDASSSRTALAAARVPGRFELLRAEPPIVVDAAHNPESAERLASAIREAFGGRAITLLLGVLADKDAAGIVRALAPVAAHIAVTRSASPRALEPAELGEIVERETGVRPEAFGSVREALEALAPDASGGLVISGSITVAGEARALLTAR